MQRHIKPQVRPKREPRASCPTPAIRPPSSAQPRDPDTRVPGHTKSIGRKNNGAPSGRLPPTPRARAEQVAQQQAAEPTGAPDPAPRERPGAGLIPLPKLTAPVALANLLATSDSWLSRRKPSTRGYRSLGTTRRKPASAILRAIRVTTVAETHDSGSRESARRGGAYDAIALRRKGGHTPLRRRVSAPRRRGPDSFRAHERRHLGEGVVRRLPLWEGGALTSLATPSVVAGKLRISRAGLSARGDFLGLSFLDTI